MTSPDDSPPTPRSPFLDFWEASRLTQLTVDQFVNRSSSWEEPGASLSVFDQASADVDLPTVDDKLQDLFASRSSSRQFDDSLMPTTGVAEILAATGPGRDGRSVIPSAGGLDPLGVFAIVLRGEAPLNGRIVHYRHREHRVAVIGDAPDEETCRRLFSLDCDGMPSLLLAFAVDPGATLSKYGERGGRFLLQQTGHAMQNVGLRLAESQRRRRGPKLHGYIVGGVLDEVADHLRIGHTRAELVGAYAIGYGSPSGT